jgi:hypothetical protein
MPATNSEKPESRRGSFSSYRRPYDRRHIGLEEADAHDDQRQRQVEHPQRGVIARHHAVDHRCGVALDRHARVPGHQQQAAKDHGLAHAQEAVGQQARR